MTALNPFTLVSALLALQFVVFGWRISREITVGDGGRRTFLFLSDRLNFLCMILVGACCLIWPLKTGMFPALSKAVLGASYVVMLSTPFLIAGHYRLFSKMGRHKYRLEGRDVPVTTDHEIVIALVAIPLALATGYFIYNGG